jgi:hypothetical protein
MRALSVSEVGWGEVGRKGGRAGETGVERRERASERGREGARMRCLCVCVVCLSLPLSPSLSLSLSVSLTLLAYGHTNVD